MQGDPSPWRLSIIKDGIWSVINFIYFLYIFILFMLLQFPYFILCIATIFLFFYQGTSKTSNVSSGGVIERPGGEGRYDVENNKRFPKMHDRGSNNPSFNEPRGPRTAGLSNRYGNLCIYFINYLFQLVVEVAEVNRYFSPLE